MTEPVSLAAALATFDEAWSPRIVASVNDYDVRVAKVAGKHVWHAHDTTDEFFLVIDGEFGIALRDRDGRERSVTLQRGDLFVVPRGTPHRPFSSGAAILMFEPTGTSTTGDRHDRVPDHIVSTTGTAWVDPVQLGARVAADPADVDAITSAPRPTAGPERDAT